ncbi:MAG: mechanosensitive ion channel family protein, partial [Parvibaculaceae bacterium]
DKFNITVGYDTDLDKARKLIKKIGLELAADPEFAPWVIEPIKMQGVQEFGDYGIILRIKVTTKPGGAFAMKRKFYLAVNKAFKENGIELPVPTVHVQQGDSNVAPAVAQSHLAARKKAAEAEEAGAS